VTEPPVFAFVDPGLANIGWAAVARYGAKVDIVDSGYIETSPKDSLDERLKKIWRGLVLPFSELRPAVVGYEDQSGPSIGARMMGLKAAARGEKAGGFNVSNDHVFECVGIVKALAWGYNARVVGVGSQALKIAVCGKGNGRADKATVMRHVMYYFPDLLKAGHKLNEHSADAIAGAIHVERGAFMSSRKARIAG
jgi:Holliday junction resolvasome RuvABC endonuclease subunit